MKRRAYKCGRVMEGTYCPGCQYPGAPWHNPARDGRYPARQCSTVRRINTVSHPEYDEKSRECVEAFHREKARWARGPVTERGQYLIRRGEDTIKEYWVNPDAVDAVIEQYAMRVAIRRYYRRDAAGSLSTRSRD